VIEAVTTGVATNNALSSALTIPYLITTSLISHSTSHWGRWGCCGGKGGEEEREWRGITHLAYIFLNELGADYSDEACVGTIGNSASAQCLTRARWPVQQYTFRWVNTQRYKLLWLLTK